jgi:uncharacterized protein (DUF1501 family)
MDRVTRRRFLLASTAGGAVLAAGSVGLAELIATADRPDAKPEAVKDKLVIITLYGGNDGLNTVVPYADPGYHAARPDLAYRPEKVLHLDAALGLNPAFKGLRKLWDDKHLAIVLGVGYPKPNRSHFRSMDIWQTASPAEPVRTGWVGRWLDGTKAATEVAVSFEPVLPPLLAGQTRAGACVSIGAPRIPSGITPQLLANLGGHQSGEPELQARAAGALTDLVQVDRVMHRALDASRAPDRSAGPTPPAPSTGGRDALAAQLTLVNLCIELGVPTRVYSVSLGGFDTHAAERGTQEKLLGQVDTAITGFVDRLARTPAGARVTTVVYSEFGRRVKANASDGTDHGTAGPVFVFGPRVAGGFYGNQPSLTDLDNGDLKASMDFRDVFGTLLASVLGADPGQYITGHQTKLLPLLNP